MLVTRALCRRRVQIKLRPPGSLERGADVNKTTITVLSVQLAGMGLLWIPLLQLGGTRIEVSNLASLFVIASMPLVALPHLRFPPVIALLYVSLFGLFAAFALHGGEGLSRLVMAVVSTTAALGLANLKGLTRATLARALVIAYPVFWAFFWLSAQLAGQDLLGGTLDYLQTLNRSVFVFQVLRPTFNAYVTTGDVTYVASTLNGLSGAFLVFFILSLACWPQGWGVKVVCITAFVTIFVLFSSSSVLPLAVICVLAAIVWIRQARSKVGPVLVVGLIVLGLVALSGDLLAYLALNIANDQGSRAARVSQYLGSIDLINASFGFGHGYISIEGHNIHNFLLFSTVSGGILLGLIVFWVMALVGWTSARAGWRYLVQGQWQDLAICGLMLFFLVRLSAGGAGGMPAGPGAVALGLACLIAADRQPALPSRGLKNPPSRRADSVPG